MFVFMLQLQLPSNQIDQAVRLWDDCIIPELKKQKGWKDAAFAASQDTGQLRIFTLWETKSQADKFESAGKSIPELGKLLAPSIRTVTRVVYQISHTEIMELFGQDNPLYLN